MDESRARYEATINAVVRLWTEKDVDEDTPFPAANSAAPLVAAVAARHDLVDLSVREPAIEEVIARMYGG
jgi:hypothetical protein